MTISTKKIMKFSRNKITATVIAMLLMLSMTTILALSQTANAHTPPYNMSTYCYIAPSPPVVGVGQQILIDWWLNAFPPDAAGATGDRWQVTVNIVRPDGKNDTFGPQASDPEGSNYIIYTPTELGTYTMQAFFPGQTITGIPGQLQNAAVNDTYGPSISAPGTFTVQETPIPSYENTPLPTDYWTRPIYDANRGWGDAVMGQWLAQPWDSTLRTLGIQNQEALLSPHILWTRPDWSGGIMGGYGDASFYNGIAYEGFSSPLICLDGMGYYAVDNSPVQGWYCINLYNGQTEYFQNNTDGHQPIPAMGQILNYESPNQGGGFSYLWQTSGVTLPAGTTSATGTSTWAMMDASTSNANGNAANSGAGLVICKIANVSTAGTEFRDDIGSICYLNIVNLGTTTNPNYYMQIWNSTQAIWWHPSYGIAPPATLYNGTTNVPLTDTSNDYWMWRPGAGANPGMSSTQYGAIYDGHNGYSMNVSIDSLLGPWNNVQISSIFGTANSSASIQAVVPGQEVIVGANGQNDARGDIPGFLRAISLAAPTWGKTLWTVPVNPPLATTQYPNNTYNGAVSMGGVDVTSGVFRFTESVTGKVWVYSIATGQQLWETDLTYPWFYQGTSMTFHDGFGYTINTAGIVNQYNATTGAILWNWTAPNIGYLEVQGTTYTPLRLDFFIDDPVTGHTMLYMDGSTGWAGQTVPIRRDSALFCLDCTTGQMVWRLEAYPSAANNAASQVVISDGHILYLDNHDNNIYCLGKGPSATTVSAPQIVPTLGSSVTITGTVTDQTPSGRINSAGSTDFTLKGTPAIGDASMEAWMEHMFQQRPLPTNATGVPVSLNAIDPNDNYVNIGNTTSDMGGNYGLPYTPEVPGTYQIIATFAGSNAYGPSSATTYLTIGGAPASTPVPTAQPQSMADMYIVPATIGIIVSIFIVGAILALLLLRKRP